MQTKHKANPPEKRKFKWGIHSADISLMQEDQMAARDGSTGDCSSYVSPLPRPKRKSAEPLREQK